MKEVANYMKFKDESSTEAIEYSKLIDAEIAAIEQNQTDKQYRDADSKYTNTDSSEEYWKTINAESAKIKTEHFNKSENVLEFLKFENPYKSIDLEATNIEKYGYTYNQYGFIKENDL